MTLQTKLNDLVTAFVTDIRDISNSIAGAANAKNATVQGALTTTSKNLVGAVNELKTAVDSASGSAVTAVNGTFGPGPVTIDTDAVGEGSTNLYHTVARVLATALTGFTSGAGTVAATDSILQALQKLDGNIAAIINDATDATTSTYSSTQIEARITAEIAAALEGEDLSDLAAQVAANAAAHGGLLSFDGAQTLTAPQQTQGQTNLGLGDIVAADFATDYTTARDA